MDLKFVVIEGGGEVWTVQDGKCQEEFDEMAERSTD